MDELETSGEGVQTQVDTTALGLERNALLEDQVRALRQMVEDQVRAFRQMSEDHEKALRDYETELLQRDESLAAMAAEIASIRLSRTWKASRFMARSAGPLLPAARTGRRQLRRWKIAGDHGMEPNLRGHVKADVSRV